MEGDTAVMRGDIELMGVPVPLLGKTLGLRFCNEPKSQCHFVFDSVIFMPLFRYFIFFYLPMQIHPFFQGRVKRNNDEVKILHVLEPEDEKKTSC